ncbi:MAG: molybdenum cofactor biosynthesis protein MoaE [Chthoniobacterales bacterium]
MAKSVCQVLLTAEPLLPPPDSAPAETGAIIDFWGVVRETETGAKIRGIDYEAHRAMAEHQLRRVAEQAEENFDLSQITIQHRLGFVPVGVASLLVRVGSRHRAEAYRASAAIVEELKKHAPIWKHPVFIKAPNSNGPGTKSAVISAA